MLREIDGQADLAVFPTRTTSSCCANRRCTCISLIGGLPGGGLAHAAGAGGDPRRENGLLVDFFSTEQIAARIDDALSMKEANDVRASARAAVIERYDMKRVCLPAQLGLVARLTGDAPHARATPDTKHMTGEEV